MVALFVLIYGVLTGGLWLIQLKASFTPGEIHIDDFADMQEIKAIHMVILAGAAGAYALYRLVRFHPAANWAYAAWLRLSPWTSAKPLPFGPVHPVWQDAVVIGVLTAIAKWHAHLDSALPIVAFGMTYLIVITFLVAMTCTWPSFIAAAFLWPSLLLPEVQGWPGIVLIVILITILWHGHRKSLRSFPWPFLTNTNRTKAAASRRSNSNLDIQLGGTSAGPSYLGWPYLVLSPKIERRPVSASTSFFLSALAGWWAYCIIKRSEMDPLPGLVLAFAVGAALLRLVIYCAGASPPFNVWGRLASGRLLQPGFDKVFLTPLAVVMVGLFGGMIIRRSGSWYPAAEACVIALLSFVLYAGRPTLQNWILTGRLRFRPPAAYTNNAQMLRRV